ncbi:MULTISPECIES: hypothetical protein [Streptomyces]|uniref:Uncharacterized protein n=3 Tax=Streptomyces TaxID=1883 RepID=A0A3S9PLT3_STRLT|nr:MULTISPECIES: hypothetical protein [Streptomyces]AZQ73321.1 hypothetical protein EKH77_20750 [Streptomyces luteoverticillatus]
MSVNDDLNAIQRSLDELGRSVDRLERQLGKGGLEVRRLRTDSDHLRDDLALLRERATRSGRQPQPVQQMVTIPDAPYDTSLWTDADEEGLGCRDRRAP